MAILNSSNNYIKITSINEKSKIISIDIYKDADSRDKIKNSKTSISTITDKYSELIKIEKAKLMQKLKDIGLGKLTVKGSTESVSEEELATYKDVSAYFKAIQCEYNQYLRALREKRGSNNYKFEIMEKYFPDIYETIPELVQSCAIGYKSDQIANTEDELLTSGYTQLKTYKIFGETTDC